MPRQDISTSKRPIQSVHVLVLLETEFKHTEGKLGNERVYEVRTSDTQNMVLEPAVSMLL